MKLYMRMSFILISLISLVASAQTIKDAQVRRAKLEKRSHVSVASFKKHLKCEELQEQVKGGQLSKVELLEIKKKIYYFCKKDELK